MGGDYNPEQWDEETFDFTWLDKIMDRLAKDNIHVCLATSTGAHPAWMAKKYPDVLRVDYEGRKRKFGGRHNSCPHSPTYRKHSQLMARKLAKRYQDHPMLVTASKGHLVGSYECGILCDLIHTEGAEVVAEYGADFYKGMPALTVNRYGKGEAWYVATSPEKKMLQNLMLKPCH